MTSRSQQKREAIMKGEEMPDRFCPDCGSRSIKSDFDPDVGKWFECLQCERRWKEEPESLSSQGKERLGSALISSHAELLNNLSDMQQSIAYAARKQVLVDAEQLIVSQEQSLIAAREELEQVKRELVELRGSYQVALEAQAGAEAERDEESENLMKWTQFYERQLEAMRQRATAAEAENVKLMELIRETVALDEASGKELSRLGIEYDHAHTDKDTYIPDSASRQKLGSE